MSISNLFKPNDYNIYANNYNGIPKGVKPSIQLVFGGLVLTSDTLLNFSDSSGINNTTMLKSPLNQYISLVNSKLTDISWSVTNTGVEYQIFINDVPQLVINLSSSKGSYPNVVENINLSVGSLLDVRQISGTPSGVTQINLNFESI